jgi:hypothetical protein
MQPKNPNLKDWNWNRYPPTFGHGGVFLETVPALYCPICPTYLHNISSLDHLSTQFILPTSIPHLQKHHSSLSSTSIRYPYMPRPKIIYHRGLFSINQESNIILNSLFRNHLQSWSCCRTSTWTWCPCSCPSTSQIPSKTYFLSFI